MSRLELVIDSNIKTLAINLSAFDSIIAQFTLSDRVYLESIARGEELDKEWETLRGLEIALQNACEKMDYGLWLYMNDRVQSRMAAIEIELRWGSDQNLAYYGGDNDQ